MPPTRKQSTKEPGVPPPIEDREPWFEFTAQTEDDPTVAELHIFGLIGGGFFYDPDAISGRSVQEKLDELPESVTTIRVLVNSPGGSVFDGVHIANALRRQREEHGRDVVVEIEALAASAATIITSAGDPIRMPRNAIYMIHNPWAVVIGSSSLLRKMAGTLDKLRNSIVSTYRWVTSMPVENIRTLMDDETWMEADEALDNGFITEISEPVSAAAATADPRTATFFNIPDAYRDQVVALFATEDDAAEDPDNEHETEEEDDTPDEEPDVDETDDEDATASAEPRKATMPPTPKKKNDTDAAARKAILAQERERIAAIEARAEAGRNAGIDKDELAKMVETAKGDDTTAEAFGEEILDMLADAGDKGPGVIPAGIEPGDDARDKWLEGATAWMLRRTGSARMVRAAAEKSPDVQALQDVELDPGEFRGMRLIDLAKQALEAQGMNTSRMHPMEIAKRACSFNPQAAAAGLGTRSDFPIMLENVLHKMLLAAYATAPDRWMSVAATGSVNDFRNHPRLKLGSLPRLDQILESGEFRSLHFPDAEKEVIAAQTFGNVIGLTRQSIVDDDVNGFSRLITMLGRAAARSIEIDVFALFGLNSGLGPTMNDTNPLFDAAHSNILSDGGVPTQARIAAARVLMAKQQDPDGNDFLDLMPSVWVGPVELGDNVREAVGAEFSDVAGDGTTQLRKPNVVRNLISEIVDTARLSGDRWYVLASPSEAPVFEVVFLEGEEMPVIEVEEGFDYDGVRWRVRHDYGVGATDFRGAATNAGT